MATSESLAIHMLNSAFSKSCRGSSLCAPMTMLHSTSMGEFSSYKNGMSISSGKSKTFHRIGFNGDLTMFEMKPELKSLGDTEYFFSNKGGSWRLETFFNIRHMKRKTVFPFIGFSGKPVPCVVSAVPVGLTEEN